MNSKAEPAKLEDLLALFENVIQPEDIIYAKISSQVSSAIVKERLRLKMNQKEFADYIHSQQSLVSRWESGKYNFSLRKLSEISAALDMKLNLSLTPRRVQRKEFFSTDTIKYSDWTDVPVMQRETTHQTTWSLFIESSHSNSFCTLQHTPSYF